MLNRISEIDINISIQNILRKERAKDISGNEQIFFPTDFSKLRILETSKRNANQPMLTESIQIILGYMHCYMNKNEESSAVEYKMIAIMTFKSEHQFR